MRSLVVIGLALLGTSPTLANDPKAIEWRADRPLTWEDFQGPVPRGAGSERVATTAASISWSYEYALEWSGQRCVFEIRAIDSAAYFHPEASWVRPGHRRERVLRHEQLHFDIAQLYENRFEAATREFIGLAQECDGRSERRAARSAERAIADLVGSAFDEIWQQYQRRQAAYDRATGHGIDSDAQRSWAREIAASLAVSP